jgi:hypothetical protein
LAAICALAFVARCWNLGDVFVAGRIYFVDGDCYSRMTRAALIADGHGPIIRHHDFENFPLGITPHTTAPLDWLIVAGKKVLDAGFWMLDREGTSILRGQTLDLSGALVSPVLGVLACAWLGWWARRVGLAGHAWVPPFLFAISPVLVHGTVLGRPDHQSLLIFLLAIALGSECWLGLPESRGTLAPGSDTGRRRPSSLGIVAGGAWGLAMWVSLYEPLVLFAVVFALWGIGDRRRFAAPEFRTGWIVFAGVLLLAVLVDGWRVVWPDAAARAAFGHWQQTIGELRHLDLRSSVLLHWLGAACVLTPALLGLAAVKERKMGAVLGVLLVLLALTIWQVRWGYFLALAYAMSLPWQLAILPRAWWGALVFVLGLWPVAQDWEAMLYPDSLAEKVRNERRAESVQLREVAAQIRAGQAGGFLAPWWLSPALAYWSGAPGVAGSSHEALAGTVESGKFFLAPDAGAAEGVARRLGVRWIITDGADVDGVSRLVRAYGPLLGGEVPAAPWGVALHERGQPRERVSAADFAEVTPELRARLLAVAERAETEEIGSAAFSCVFKNQFFKLFRVKEPPTQ